MLTNILLLTLFGSLLSLGGGFILFKKKSWKAGWQLKFTSFAAGVLLATAFLDLFPESLHEGQSEPESIFLAALGGIILFFLLERTLLWFHHHHAAHDTKPTVWMVSLGDGLHNFIDGVAIASAFLLNPAVGISTAIAVAAHEIPQEIADFSILLSQGLSKSQAILFNIASALTALIGAILTYYYAQSLTPYLSSVIAFTAGMFSYIALSDLIPELHHANSTRETIPQALAFIFGILLVILTKSILSTYRLEV